MKRHSQTLMFALSLYTAPACVPEVEDADTLVSGPRVLAIRSQPAELAPRSNGTFTALFVDEDGASREAPFDWSFCTARKPLAELGPVNPLCLLEDPEQARALELEPDAGGGEERDPILEELGEGIETEGRVPSTACRYFGPDRPPPMDGQPAGRPVDPDPTGGYYQPLRIFNRDDSSVALYEARITCGLPGAGREATVAYNQRFAPNDNPAIDALIVASDGERALAPAAEREPLRVRPGEALSLELRWARCDPLEPCDAADEEMSCEPPPPCDGAQTYVYYDPETRSVFGRREGMRASWFSTAGAFRDARTGRTEQEADTTYSANLWTAPDREGDVTLWVVLRDDRGGVSWQTYAISIER